MRKLMLLCLIALGVTVGVIAPVASAHTPTVTATCDTVEFDYANFPGTTSVATETYQIDNQAPVVHTFTFHTATASDSFALNLANTGTHTITASSSTNDTPDDGNPWNSAPYSVTIDCGTPPPPPSCTYTKGFYRNHPDAVPAGLKLGTGTLTQSQAQQILEATPGKPGNVTFKTNGVTDNNLLNVVQQLLTAEINSKSSTPPAAVTAAMAAINAAITSGGSINITASSDLSSQGDILDKQYNSKFDCS